MYPLERSLVCRVTNKICPVLCPRALAVRVLYISRFSETSLSNASGIRRFERNPEIASITQVYQATNQPVEEKAPAIARHASYEASLCSFAHGCITYTLGATHPLVFACCAESPLPFNAKVFPT